MSRGWGEPWLGSGHACHPWSDSTFGSPIKDVTRWNAWRGNIYWPCLYKTPSGGSISSWPNSSVYLSSVMSSSCTPRLIVPATCGKKQNVLYVSYRLSLNKRRGERSYWTCMEKKCRGGLHRGKLLHSQPPCYSCWDLYPRGEAANEENVCTTNSTTKDFFP